MKPKQHGWKEGTLTRDLLSYGNGLANKGPDHKKGDTVRYRRYKARDENGYWTGGYEWHYLDTDNYNLVRTRQLLIAEEDEST